jgi:hypothetical protein
MTHTPPSLGHVLPADVPRTFMLAYTLNGCRVGWDSNGALVVQSQETGKKLIITREELTRYATELGINQLDPRSDTAGETWPESLDIQSKGAGQ